MTGSLFAETKPADVYNLVIAVGTILGVLMVLVFLGKIYLVGMFRHSNRLLLDTITIVRENLQVQNTVNAAVLELVKGYRLLAASEKKEVKTAIQQMKDVVAQKPDSGKIPFPESASDSQGGGSK